MFINQIGNTLVTVWEKIIEFNQKCMPSSYVSKYRHCCSFNDLLQNFHNTIIWASALEYHCLLTLEMRRRIHTIFWYHLLSSNFGLLDCHCQLDLSNYFPLVKGTECRKCLSKVSSRSLTTYHLYEDQAGQVYFILIKPILRCEFRITISSSFPLLCILFAVLSM